VIITVNGTLIARRALHDVLDGNVPEKLAAEIRSLAQQVPGVVEIEKCRIRKSGIGLFIELHVRVRGETTVREGHEIGHAVKKHLLASNPRILDTVIHLEPADPA
jgi:divalent metal cation (Fe/Co/Zn/Cd) transporter